MAREDWWTYVKRIISDYPSLCGREFSTQSDYADKEECTPALKKKLRYEAVRRAIDATISRKDGADRLEVVRLVYWNRTHTLAGAAMIVHCSERTAKRWNSDFIHEVERSLNLP